MKLSDIFDYLISGELNNTNLGMNLEEGVSPHNYRQLVNYINLGLLDLYSEFPLRTQQVYIQLEEDIHLYHLRKEYCITNTESSETNKYIIDTVDNPFYESVLKIDAVFNEIGDAVSIEDELDPLSVFIPEFDTLQVRCPNEHNAIYVMYRAAPNRLDSNVHNMHCDQYFNLPYALIEALLTYVAAKVYSTKTSQELVNKSVMLFNKYGMLKEQYRARGLTSDAMLNKELVRNKGWV